jgi:hypothetical protein
MTDATVRMATPTPRGSPFRPFDLSFSLFSRKAEATPKRIPMNMNPGVKK